MAPYRMEENMIPSSMDPRLAAKEEVILRGDALARDSRKPPDLILCESCDAEQQIIVKRVGSRWSRISTLSLGNRNVVPIDLIRRTYVYSSS